MLLVNIKLHIKLYIIYYVQVGHVMAPVFKALDIQFESRSAAIGNNPCLPYDACVSYLCNFS